MIDFPEKRYQAFFSAVGKILRVTKTEEGQRAVELSDTRRPDSRPTAYRLMNLPSEYEYSLPDFRARGPHLGGGGATPQQRA